MWQVVNHTPFQTAGYFLRDARGAEHWVIAMRLTLDLPENGLPVLAERQLPVNLLPSYDAAGEEMLEDSGIAPFRPQCDILLRGGATPDDSKSALSFPVTLSVGKMERIIHCHGPRRLVRDRLPLPGGWSASDLCRHGHRRLAAHAGQRHLCRGHILECRGHVSQSRSVATDPLRGARVQTGCDNRSRRPAG